jgi:N-methylhydantoinase A
VRYRIGIDVGGTFTDLVYVADGSPPRIVKTPTTAENEAVGVLQGLTRIASQEGLSLRELLSRSELIVHGTTVATNAMIQAKGARTGLLTTKGFRDDIELRRGMKERIFDPRYPPPFSVAPRRRRLTVDERVDSAGQVLKALDEGEVRQRLAAFRTMDIEALAVCLLFSFLNPSHEKRIAELARAELPGVYLSLSHETLPQVREFERVSTTLVNAYVGPCVARYLDELAGRLASETFGGRLLIMQSSGGLMDADYLSRNAVCSLLSGPAGGVIAAAHLACIYNVQDFVTVDMGGTSYDVCLVRDGRPAVTTESWVCRYRVAVPMLAIHTIGAGGGSIAWVDPGGALHVGPQSAGAEPGPACYGKGGEQPTVTDANLLLGYLDPQFFLGGEMPLQPEAAWRTIERKVAKPLGLDPVQAAEGIFRIVNHNMVNGVKMVSVRKGHDPRGLALLAFGGNGPLHAGIQAKELGMQSVLIPKAATALSALGLLLADLKVNGLRSYPARSDRYDLAAINAHYGEMLREAREEMIERLGWQQRETGTLVLSRWIDCYYKGQTYEISVPIGTGDSPLGEGDVAEAVRSFHQLHEQLHTFSFPDAPVHFLNLRLELLATTAKPSLARLPQGKQDASPALNGYRQAYFAELGGFTKTPIYDGNALAAGNRLQGPSIVEEPGCTVVLFPGQQAIVDNLGSYLVTSGEA